MIHQKQGGIWVLVRLAPSIHTVGSLFKVIREQAKRSSRKTEANKLYPSPGGGTPFNVRVMLRVALYYSYAEWCYVESGYAECHGPI